MSAKKKIAIIGGGAAGVFAGVNAAEKNPGYEIHIFESGNKALSKVLISGGGRCNVTNYTLNPKDLVTHYPRGGKELLGPFTTFGVSHTMEWFTSRGASLKVEEDKRVFPQSNKSQTIANCLLERAREMGVHIHESEKIYAVEKDQSTNQFILHLKDKKITSDVLLIASGGNDKSFELAKSLGHTIVPPMPSLFTFEITDPLIEDLSGVSFKEAHASISINKKTYTHTGPLLITHWGLSGPAIIVLSAHAARALFEQEYRATLHINFIPQHSFESATQTLKTHRSNYLQKKIQATNPFDLPSSFWERFITLNLPGKDMLYQELSKGMIHTLIQTLRNTQFQIKGKGKFKEEFVTSGGVRLKEVNFKTMESRICPNLYFAGEVLNIDGVTGGFNFQSAWTTGWIASQYM